MTDLILIDEIKALVEIKNSRCITLIIPTHRQGQDKRIDHILLKNLVENARTLAYEKYGKANAEPLLERLKDMVTNLDFDHLQDGLGLYISADTQKSVRFPFAVETKVSVDDHFEVRELVYKSSLSLPYHVLVLTEKEGRLFEGTLTTLHEIHDSKFSDAELETYEYARPARSSSRAGYAHEKSFEKDKSILEEIRVKDFFHHLDERLNRYLRPNAPLFVFGTKEILGYYKEMTKHSKRMAGMETGSYGNTGTAQIGMMVWPLMEAFLKRKYAQYIGEFQEKIGVGQGASGIQSVWNVAHEGRGWRLLMEKDFRCPGFVTLDDQFLHLTAPLQAHRIITDAVQEIMEMVMRKNGEVVMVDNGMLSAFDRIALITRY